MLSYLYISLGSSYGILRSWEPHDRGGFFLLLRLIHGDDERFLPVLVMIMEVWDGCPSPRVDLLEKFLRMRLHLRRGRLPYVTSPPSTFAAKLSLEFHGLNNWAILLLGLCYLFLGLTPVQH
ncbi:hypothetical protein P8452_48704 [Trifolium repens]|nr:hypothetical protein P8452_48704 [Trifolium repens]